MFFLSLFSWEEVQCNDSHSQNYISIRLITWLRELISNYSIIGWNPLYVTLNFQIPPMWDLPKGGALTFNMDYSFINMIDHSLTIPSYHVCLIHVVRRCVISFSLSVAPFLLLIQKFSCSHYSLLCLPKADHKKTFLQAINGKKWEKFNNE